MIEELLTKETIQFSQEKLNWKEAISLTAAPLLNSGKVSENYIKAMIHNIEVLGPYVIIGSKIAIPHARPEEGVHEIGMSLLKLEHPTYLLDDKENQVEIIICLAAIDSKSHLKALAQLTRLLSNRASMQALIQAKIVEDILKLIKKHTL